MCNVTHPLTNLQAAWQADGTLSLLEKASVRTTMRQLAQAVAYTHERSIIHRDLKPENCLLQDNGNISLCDFGISKDIISHAYESTVNFSACGTAAYCSPEAGKRHVSDEHAALCISAVLLPG